VERLGGTTALADPRDSTNEVYWNRKKYPGGEYEGQYKNGKRSGDGRYTWDDGRAYEGSFMEGLAEVEPRPSPPHSTAQHSTAQHSTSQRSGGASPL